MRIRTTAAALAGAVFAAGLVAGGAAPAQAARKPTCGGKANEMWMCFYPDGDKFCITNKSRVRGNFVGIEWFTPYNGKERPHVYNKRGYNKTVCKSFSKSVAEKRRVNFRGWLYNGGGTPIDMSKGFKATS